ncbi:MAG TPA: hypothetical protein VN841_14080 [Bryobacteraceae bacterium]|nr:hypothetical protein [Bryobacteraceae bacterium]
MIISNYEIVENLAETAHATIFKAHHRRDPDRPLVLKILKATSLSDDQKAHFRQRIEHLKVLKDRSVTSPARNASHGARRSGSLRRPAGGNY